MAQLGKQSGWEKVLPRPGEMPTRKSIGLLKTRLVEVEARRATLLKQGDALVTEFRSKYLDSPAYLVRYADRTLNDYRWRLSGSAKWRHIGMAGNKVAVDLTSEKGKTVLASLPFATQNDWLRFEARRQVLNFQSAMTKYEVMRLRSLIERQEELRQLVRRGGA